MYGDAFVDRAAGRHGGFDADLMATLTEFVARTVASASASATHSARPWRRSSRPVAA